MIGQVFNSWTILRELERDKYFARRYECRCKCGTIRIIRYQKLKDGKPKRCIKCNAIEMFDPLREIGKIYNKLTVVEFIGSPRGNQIYRCKCECGNEKISKGIAIRLGTSRQCKSCSYNQLSKSKKKHDMRHTRIYRIWTGMLSRCNNEKEISYKNYGARGIKVCERWFKFENFLEDMGECPIGYQIDRTNNDGNYEPGNCKWVTPKENANNTRRSKKNKEKEII